MAYATRNRRPPPILSAEEQTRILKVTGEHKDGFRDHVLISLALGTGLRESELVALDLGDVTEDGKRVHRTIELRTFKRAGEGRYQAEQKVHLPDATFYKLDKYARAAWADAPTAVPEERGWRPLFVSRKGGRLSVRQVRHLWRVWQKRAGFKRLYRFHSLRHTAISNVVRVSSLKHGQVFARHARLGTTADIYTHITDDEMRATVKGLES